MGVMGNLVAKLTKGSRQHLCTLLLFPGTHFVALLDKSHAFMQDLPNYATESMGNGPDSGPRPENDCLSWRRQRARLGSALDAGIYCLSRSDCYGSLPRFLACPDRFPPKTSTPPPTRRYWPAPLPRR